MTRLGYRFWLANPNHEGRAGYLFSLWHKTRLDPRDSRRWFATVGYYYWFRDQQTMVTHEVGLKAMLALGRPYCAVFGQIRPIGETKVGDARGEWKSDGIELLSLATTGGKKHATQLSRVYGVSVAAIPPLNVTPPQNAAEEVIRGHVAERLGAQLSGSIREYR